MSVGVAAMAFGSVISQRRGDGRAGVRAGGARRTAVRIHGRASRARRRLPLDWALTIVSTSMVVRTTIAAMAILSSVERPEATSMVSMVSIVPPTQQKSCWYVRERAA